MKKSYIEVISLILSIFSLLTCEVFMYPFSFGFYGIFDFISLILALFCCIKKVIQHDRTRMVMVLVALLLSFVALMRTIDTYIRYMEILSHVKLN